MNLYLSFRKNITEIIKKRFLIYSLSTFFLFIILVFTLWSFSLFNQLEIITSRRALRNPTQFYAQYPILEPGMDFSLKELIRHLENIGYLKQNETPSESGQYYKIDNQTIKIFFRTFIYPDKKHIAGLYRLTFKDDSLKRIEKFPEEKKIDELPLEPISLGGFSKEGAETKPWIPLDKIPSSLKLSLITSEDKRFYHHIGIDPKSLLRAIWINFHKKGVYQGGSTLTQQLVKNAFLTHERTIKRKLTEALLALAMEARYDKDTIFETYLNQIYLGKNGFRGIYGVEDASQSYFGKHVSELSLSESALIVGLIPAPNFYNPRFSLERSIQKRDVVLDNLLKNNCISYRNWLQAKQEEIVLSPLSSAGIGMYFLDHVINIMQEQFSDVALDFQGYKVFTPLDWDMQKAAEKAVSNQPLDGALIAMDPTNGHIKAFVGGKNFIKSPFNRAINAHRHPGSAFKPFIYAAAIESKLVNLTTFIEDKPIKIETVSGIWEPQNYDEDFTGTITVRDALVYSRNVPSVNILELIGTDRVIELSKACGIKSELLAVPSLALGTSEVTPLELTASYAPFANKGITVEPVFIKCITDSNGNILKDYKTQTSRALSEETAYIITDVLKDVIKRGTGKNVRKLGFKTIAAGKTGTSDNYYDAWFVGYTPDLLCGVWLGFDQPKSLDKAAAHIAIPVWVDFMKEVYKNKTIDEDFEKPSGVKRVTIDPESYLKARSGCPNRMKELYIKGTEPKEYCPLHKGGIPGFFERLFKSDDEDEND